MKKHESHVWVNGEFIEVRPAKKPDTFMLWFELAYWLSIIGLLAYMGAVFGDLCGWWRI